MRFRWDIQGQTQGAGTPNQAGVDFFIPISVDEQSVWFVDTQFNANFGDFDGSSIVNTDVAGTTLSTSTRLGYRWLNDDRSWMYGVNTGYDTRNLNTGDAPVTVTDKRDVTFQQVAFGLEAVNDDWNFNAYALVPTGDTEKVLNSLFNGGSLDTYGLDVGYSITPDLDASLGYYYQSGDMCEADGNGVLAQLSYAISNNLTLGVNLSHDDAFDTRLSGNFIYRFGSRSSARPIEKKAWEKPTVIALSESVKQRNIRVHDGVMCTTRRAYRSPVSAWIYPCLHCEMVNGRPIWNSKGRC